ncbi:MAG: hypothetical protein WBB60_09100 [Nitrospira sp.]|nr:hypothetical protein [Nitrospira sp.]MBP6605070.1 hypothetical protein [Nitrospira sp.]MCI1280474.1 hypothetical protein [Nitrospira sp.]HQY56672.1 hypothetical protein [Nitrospira sp.]HRA95708.1 hypothetical protein [Nitrospira sp.]
MIEYLSALSAQAEWAKVMVEELKRAQKEQVRPLEWEGIRRWAGLNEK